MVEKKLNVHVKISHSIECTCESRKKLNEPLKTMHCFCFKWTIIVNSLSQILKCTLSHHILNVFGKHDKRLNSLVVHLYINLLKRTNEKLPQQIFEIYFVISMLKVLKLSKSLECYKLLEHLLYSMLECLAFEWLHDWFIVSLVATSSPLYGL